MVSIEKSLVKDLARHLNEINQIMKNADSSEKTKSCYKIIEGKMLSFPNGMAYILNDEESLLEGNGKSKVKKILKCMDFIDGLNLFINGDDYFHFYKDNKKFLDEIFIDDEDNLIIRASETNAELKLKSTKWEDLSLFQDIFSKLSSIENKIVMDKESFGEFYKLSYKKFFSKDNDRMAILSYNEFLIPRLKKGGMAAIIFPEVPKTSSSFPLYLRQRDGKYIDSVKKLIFVKVVTSHYT